ncbi:TonB-dependent receptor plug domain-containing protein, partial [Oleiphilus sp. HI0061]
MNLKVTVASVFEESELDAASSVSLLTENDWQKTGAKRLSDVLESVPSVASYPTWGGAEAIAIRGFTT